MKGPVIKGRQLGQGQRKCQRWREPGSLLLLMVFLFPALVGGQSSTSAPGVPAQKPIPDERQANREAVRLILEQGLMTRNADHRCEVVMALSLMHIENDPFPLLETALADKDVYVQVAACATLSG
ncbi:MAG: hypothetical protein ACUVR8_04975 [Acidobacteriota bacterium]